MGQGFPHVPPPRPASARSPLPPSRPLSAGRRGAGRAPAFPRARSRRSIAALVLYSSLDAPLARPLVEAFQRLHPTVAVRYEDLLTGEIALRVMAETDSGGTTADLVFSSAMDLTVKLANDGYAAEVDLARAASWPDWAAWRGMVFALTFEPPSSSTTGPPFPTARPTPAPA